MRTVLSCLAAAALAGCAARPVPVILQGSPTATAWLAGEWHGEYWGGAGGRVGIVNFSMSGAGDSLYAEVTMLDPFGRAAEHADTPDRHRIHARGPQSLVIEVVRVRDDAITGQLEPYIAPDCDCLVSTTFAGNIRGDTIAGRFVTHYPGGVWVEGFWQVTRVGSGPSAATGRPFAALAPLPGP